MFQWVRLFWDLMDFLMQDRSVISRFYNILQVYVWSEGNAFHSSKSCLPLSDLHFLQVNGGSCLYIIWLKYLHFGFSVGLPCEQSVFISLSND